MGEWVAEEVVGRSEHHQTLSLIIMYQGQRMGPELAGVAMSNIALTYFGRIGSLLSLLRLRRPFVCYVAGG